MNARIRIALVFGFAALAALVTVGDTAAWQAAPGAAAAVQSDEAKTTDNTCDGTGCCENCVKDGKCTADCCKGEAGCCKGGSEGCGTKSADGKSCGHASAAKNCCGGKGCMKSAAAKEAPTTR